MAVSGAGGWVPSCGIAYRYGRIVSVGLTQNKPRECVEGDIATAVRRVRAGEIVQVDMRGGNYTAVVFCALRGAGRGDASPCQGAEGKVVQALGKLESL